MSPSADVIVIGAGIVGCACAWRLARDGARVHVIDRGPPGSEATAAGMGHLVALDDSPAQLSLTAYGLACWQALRDQLPAQVEWMEAGTLWLATQDQELAEARTRVHALQAAGVACELLDGRSVHEAEPGLAKTVCGGLHVPGDRIIYPPVAARWLVEQAEAAGARLEVGPSVRGIGDGWVRLSDGRTLTADTIVDAAGVRAIELLDPGLGPAAIRVRARRGHLAITDRHAAPCRNQLIELGYLASAHGDSDPSIAFNLQPRATGQLLIGSSREYGITGREVDWEIVAAMVRRACQFFPRLRNTSITRTWTGLRAATDDGLPLIGRLPGTRGIWLAAGHEGLGITTALATAELIADGIAGRPSAIDAAAYSPERTIRRRVSA